MIREIIEIIKLFKEQKQDKHYDSYRSERIYVRVTKEEKDCIKKLAKCQLMDSSTFVRHVILSKYIDDFIKIN